jgi:hypothetical protein
MPMAAAGYHWSCAYVMNKIMLEGQDFNACSWGLMNFTYVIMFLYVILV